MSDLTPPPNPAGPGGPEDPTQRSQSKDPNKRPEFPGLDPLKIRAPDPEGNEPTELTKARRQVDFYNRLLDDLRQRTATEGFSRSIEVMEHKLRGARQNLARLVNDPTIARNGITTSVGTTFNVTWPPQPWPLNERYDILRPESYHPAYRVARHEEEKNQPYLPVIFGGYYDPKVHGWHSDTKAITLWPDGILRVWDPTVV